MDAAYVMSSIERYWNVGKVTKLKGQVPSADVCQN